MYLGEKTKVKISSNLSVKIHHSQNFNGLLVQSDFIVVISPCSHTSALFWWLQWLVMVKNYKNKTQVSIKWNLLTEILWLMQIHASGCLLSSLSRLSDSINSRWWHGGKWIQVLKRCARIPAGDFRRYSFALHIFCGAHCCVVSVSQPTQAHSLTHYRSVSKIGREKYLSLLSKPPMWSHF